MPLGKSVFQRNYDLILYCKLQGLYRNSLSMDRCQINDKKTRIYGVRAILYWAMGFHDMIKPVSIIKV